MRGISLLLALAALWNGPSSSVEGAPGAPGQLRCEGLTNPLGIDRPEPRLSWMIPHGVRGSAQTAYQVLVAETPEAIAADQKTL